MTHCHILVTRLRKLVAKHRGEVVSDGSGGYDVLAGEGYVWKAGEVYCQPVPLGEADGWMEKEEMVRTALACVAEGRRKA